MFTLPFPSTSRAARESLDQHVTIRGAPRLLEYLSKSQIPLAVATRERMMSAKYNLELLGSDAKRTVVITRDGVCRVKNPISTCSLPQRLGASIESAIIVGDSIWDMLAARRARDDIHEGGAHGHCAGLRIRRPVAFEQILSPSSRPATLR